MKKERNIAKKSISKQEFKLLDSVGRANLRVFSVKDAHLLTGMPRERCYQVLSQMKQKGTVSEIEGGKYVSTIPSPPDILSIASNVIHPSYISFWSALSFHGFTEQLPRMVFIATTKRKRAIAYEDTQMKFITISPSRFFGYTRLEGDVTMADKEKSLVDSLLLPRYAGGIHEFAKCLSNAWKEIRAKALVDYASRMGNRSLIKRLGYLIDTLKLPIDAALTQRLRDELGKGYSLLDPLGRRSGGYDKRWMLRLNLKVMLREKPL